LQKFNQYKLANRKHTLNVVIGGECERCVDWDTSEIDML